jgi:hypothetical protein
MRKELGNDNILKSPLRGDPKESLRAISRHHMRDHTKGEIDKQVRLRINWNIRHQELGRQGRRWGEKAGAMRMRRRGKQKGWDETIQILMESTLKEGSGRFLGRNYSKLCEEPD